MTIWLVQDVGLNSQQIYNTFKALEFLNFKFKNFGVIQGMSKITNLDNIIVPDNLNHPLIMRGGTKIISLLENCSNLAELNSEISQEMLQYSDLWIKKLRSSIFYNEKLFDQAYYNTLDIPLLNKNSEVLPFEVIKNKYYDKNMFIKPSRDQKAFTAGILPEHITISNYITNVMHQSFYVEEAIIIAPVQEIKAEYRFMVVDSQIITGSMYRINNQIQYSNNIPSHILETAKEYAKLYNPHDIFTMDLAEMVDGSIKIVEYNCWNCSGFYLCDIPKICNAVNEFIISTHYKNKTSDS